MRIKEEMKNKGITQQELADNMNVSLSAVKQMLNADSLTTKTIEKIAEALGVKMWELFASKEEVIGEQKDNTYITCPHCGKPISIHLGTGE